MDPDNPKPNTKRPEVFKKINSENLLVIERGLLGDIPDKLKPQSQVQLRRPNDLPVSKPINVFGSHLNDFEKPTPGSPDLENVTPLEEESPLKKTFSFRDKFFRKSLFGKEKQEKSKAKHNDTILVDKEEVERRSFSKSNKEKDSDHKSKKFWKRKSKEDKEKKSNKPLYTRSKSFEFLPKAANECEEVPLKDLNLKHNRHSFIHSSNGSLNDTNHLYDEYVIDECPENSIDENKRVQYYLGDKHLPRKLSSNEASSLSTVNSTNSGSHTENPVLTASFIDLCDKFDKVVDYFNENYTSDSEPYTKLNSVKKININRAKRKSSSFSSLPSPKVIQLNSVKVSEISDDFRKELSKVINDRKSGIPVNCRTERRGSVTDWFVLEEFAKKSSENVKSVSDKYRRQAQKKPVKRVRRISSTKYWITPEECAVYSRERRPPLVIPRITQYKPPRYERRQLQNAAHTYPEDNLQDTASSIKSSVRQYERLHDWSPTSERTRVELERGFHKADSPTFGKISKRFGGSTENLLNPTRRPNHLQLPPSSSGDSLDVEIRESSNRSRKSRSMVAPKQHIRSPVPAPRMILPQCLNETPVIHEGPVKRTKFAESMKKCKKHWVDSYMILTPTALVFYKDQKNYNASKAPKQPGTPPSPSMPRVELVLPLMNAHALPCITTHTRRHTRSLIITVNYDKYLVQDETEDGAKHWLSLIQNVIYRLGPPTLEEYNQSQSTDVESIGRTPSVSRHHAKVKQKAGGSSNEDLSDATDVSVHKTHVRSILRKFFPKRPAMEVLINKGIYKDEPVFGRNLSEVCPTTGLRVPEFVVACVKEIEASEENMSADGLYRASGNLSQVQKIRLEIDQNNLSVLKSYPDIHVLTGSLKLFFRELKEPLIPCALFDRILSACSIKPKDAKIKEFKEIVNALPPCNRDTLKFLLEHLLRVTGYSESNRMHTANLAIVFGPTLLWAPAEQAHNIAIDCIQQNNVVDTLLTDFKDIFPEDTKTRKKS